MDHHVHSPFGTEEKSLIERTMQYIKDRTECFDDYFSCRLENCKLKHVKNRMNPFIDYHNKEMANAQFNSAIESALNLVIDYVKHALHAKPIKNIQKLRN